MPSPSYSCVGTPSYSLSLCISTGPCWCPLALGGLGRVNDATSMSLALPARGKPVACTIALCCLRS